VAASHHGNTPYSGNSGTSVPVTPYTTSVDVNRRGEVLGLRWSDIDLRAETLTVNQARVLVEYRVRIEEPKSRNGKRTLPLDGEVVAALIAKASRATADHPA
jgi:hypothetical protein